MEKLYLSSNQLTGEIPSELGDLSNLDVLYLSQNRLTGCIPPGLQRVTNNDFSELGLPFCVVGNVLEFPAEEMGERSVAENTGAGMPIGDPVQATSSGTTLTYTLGGTDAADFAIVSGTGQIMTKAALDYETKASYAVTVTATDGDNASDSIDVTITVTDVAEEEPADPVGRYDKNNNGRIDKDELVDGVFDYNVEQTLSKSELVELIFSYEIG